MGAGGIWLLFVMSAFDVPDSIQDVAWVAVMVVSLLACGAGVRGALRAQGADRADATALTAMSLVLLVWVFVAVIGNAVDWKDASDASKTLALASCLVAGGVARALLLWIRPF